MNVARLPRTAAVLGGGAVGSVLLPALRTIGVRVVAAWSRTVRTPQWRTGPFPRAMREAELVILAVADSAVGPLCKQLVAERLVGPGQIVVHLAGALDLTPLAPAIAAGARAGSLHPLRAVPPGSRADALAGAAAGIDGSDDEVRGMLGALAQSLSMLPLAAEGSRALYHAAAVLAGGAQVALFSEAVRAFQQATGASEPDARAALLPLAKGALESLTSREPAQAITGPVPRGDAETVATHLRALAAHDARTAALYRQLSNAAVELSRQGERATAEQLAPIEGALSRGPAPAEAARAPAPAAKSIAPPRQAKAAAAKKPAATEKTANRIAAKKPAATKTTASRTAAKKPAAPRGQKPKTARAKASSAVKKAPAKKTARATAPRRPAGKPARRKR